MEKSTAIELDTQQPSISRNAYVKITQEMVEGGQIKLGDSLVSFDDVTDQKGDIIFKAYVEYEVIGKLPKQYSSSQYPGNLVLRVPGGSWGIYFGVDGKADHFYKYDPEKDVVIYDTIYERKYQEAITEVYKILRILSDVVSMGRNNIFVEYVSMTGTALNVQQRTLILKLLNQMQKDNLIVRRGTRRGLPAYGITDEGRIFMEFYERGE